MCPTCISFTSVILLGASGRRFHTPSPVIPSLSQGRSEGHESGRFGHLFNGIVKRPVPFDISDATPQLPSFLKGHKGPPIFLQNRRFDLELWKGAHEAVTAYGREALLRAKEAAEDMGFTVLHLYVDGLWVKKPGAKTKEDFQPLLEKVSRRTNLPIGLDGVYRWVAFLPSRMNKNVPVANRYFGVFQDGSLKVRGIEARRLRHPGLHRRNPDADAGAFGSGASDRGR